MIKSEFVEFKGIFYYQKPLSNPISDKLKIDEKIISKTGLINKKT